MNLVALSNYTEEAVGGWSRAMRSRRCLIDWSIPKLWGGFLFDDSQLTVKVTCVTPGPSLWHSLLMAPIIDWSLNTQQNRNDDAIVPLLICVRGALVERRGSHLYEWGRDVCPGFFFSSYGEEWHWKNGSDLNDLAEVTLIRLEDQICIKLMKDTGFGDEALVETRRWMCSCVPCLYLLLEYVVDWGFGVDFVGALKLLETWVYVEVWPRTSLLFQSKSSGFVRRLHRHCETEWKMLF